jgi:hypothetical protein
MCYKYIGMIERARINLEHCADALSLEKPGSGVILE